jgi:hypothetical protein
MLKSCAGTLIVRLSSTQFALTGHDEYIPLFRSNIDAPEAFVKVVRGEIIPQIKQDAYSALINLSSDPFIAETLVRPVLLPSALFREPALHKSIAANSIFLHRWTTRTTSSYPSS